MKQPNLFTRNKKIAKMSGAYTVNFGIPAYKEASGKLTCPFASDCIKGCYAQAGAYVWSNVKAAFQRRYELTLTDKFVSTVNAELKSRKKIKRVRIHDSGDFYSVSYLYKWIEIMKSNPSIEFYAYTKSVKMLKSFVLPKNFTVIFSLGGKQDHLIEKSIDRHAAVFSSEFELFKAGYVDGTDDDNVASSNISNKIGLVFHGVKSKQWSTAT